MCVSQQFPSKFALVSQHGSKLRVEPLSVTAQGLRFRYDANGTYFRNTEHIINWFKKNASALPSAPPGKSTPQGRVTPRSGGHMGSPAFGSRR